jgi:solute:Na+ symporter, SSS family
MMLVICVVTKMAFCLYAGAMVLQELVGWDIMPTVAALAIATAIITIVGGFAVVAYTDAIHAPIMILGSAIVLGIGLYQVGGWDHMCGLLAASPDPVVQNAMHMYKPYTDRTYPFWGILLGSVYGGAFYWGMDQVNVQRMLGAKNLDHARWGAMFAVALKLTPAFIFALPGVILLALKPGLDYRKAFIVVLNDMLPPGIRGYVLSALVGAIISALIAVMNSISTMAVRDFYLYFRPKTPERTQVVLGRVAIVLSAAAGAMAAFLVYKQGEGIYKYLQTVSIYLVAPIVPALLLGIMSKRVTYAGAVWSVLSGLVLSGFYLADCLLSEAVAPDKAKAVFPWLHYTLTENYTFRGAWETLLIIIVLFAVSAVTKKTDQAKLAQTTIDWSRSREPFRGLVDWQLHFAVLMLVTAALYAWFW